ncbi:MAG: hypothetical protein N2V78_00395 [Methanophagales archaeon]|nr:hypothetical protein [Methanophagales archaeon]
MRAIIPLISNATITPKTAVGVFDVGVGVTLGVVPPAVTCTLCGQS